MRISLFAVTIKIKINVILVGGPNEDQKFIDVRMNAIKRRILVLSGKGGQ